VVQIFGYSISLIALTFGGYPLMLHSSF